MDSPAPTLLQSTVVITIGFKNFWTAHTAGVLLLGLTDKVQDIQVDANFRKTKK